MAWNLTLCSIGLSAAVLVWALGGGSGLADGQNATTTQPEFASERIPGLKVITY